MHDKLFFTPIRVGNDGGDTVQLATLADAHKFLSARSEGERTSAYNVARKACEVAAAGYITME